MARESDPRNRWGHLSSRAPAVGRGVFCSGGPCLWFYGLIPLAVENPPCGLKQFACRARGFANNNDSTGRSRGKTPLPTAGTRLIPSGLGRSETLVEHLGDVVDLIFGDGCTEAIFHLVYLQLPGAQGYGGLFVQEIR